MNIELAFIKSTENERVVEMVNERLNGRLRDIRLCIQMDVPDSYESILANEEKRKVAISSSKNGWIAIIESKEVNDYAMLLQLSIELETEVLAIIQSVINEQIYNIAQICSHYKAIRYLIGANILR